MADPIALMLSDLTERYAEAVVANEFTRLYVDDAQFGRVFASLHEQLNQHFDQINDRARSTHHYWADNSRSLLALIDELDQTLRTLKRAGIEVVFSPDYRAALDRCTPWLSSSGGSTVPEDFEQIPVIKYEAVFTRPETTVRLQKQQSAVPLRVVGEGSYAIVFSFVDPDYGIKFAVKRAKKGLGERDLHRFRQEFDVLKRLSFPYVIDVYQYDDARNEYKMEYCDATLRTYIAKRNSSLSFAVRKRIALQFLYGINYIHGKGLLHRDISFQNVLLKVFRDGAVLVKLSDFGLVKDQSSTFTRTQTEMRGTIRDPQLQDFKSYAVVNEIYCLGWVLAYIFTGKESLPSGEDDVSGIIRRCTEPDPKLRYQRVLELIADVERLEARPSGAIA